MRAKAGRQCHSALPPLGTWTQTPLSLLLCGLPLTANLCSSEDQLYLVWPFPWYVVD